MGSTPRRPECPNEVASQRVVRVKAKALRHDPTDCERLLWQRLKSRQLGVMFRRQHPYDGFILDFVCLSKKLVVEVDGSQHLETQVIDQDRTEALGFAGFRVLRFWNHEVIEEMDSVLEVIHRTLQEGTKLTVGPHPLPSPPLEGEGAHRARER